MESVRLGVYACILLHCTYSKISAAPNASLTTSSPGISNEASTVETTGIVDVSPITQTNTGLIKARRIGADYNDPDYYSSASSYYYTRILIMLESYSTVLGSTVSSPIVPFLPMSAMAPVNKFPGGMQGALLSLLIESGSLNVKSLTQLMVSLAPHLPSLLKGILKTNTSGLTHAGQMCHEDMDAFLNDTMAKKMWAIGMLDASGKPGPALMKGAIRFYGNFDECLESVSDVSPVKGRAVRGDTCVVSLNPPPQLTALQEDIPDSLMSLAILDWHLCVPDTCGSQSIRTGLETGLSQLNISITRVTCHSEVKPGPLGDDPAAIGAIVLITMLGFLVLLGTILDMNIRVTKGRREKEGTTVGLDAVKLHEICTNPNAGEKIVEPSVLNGKISDNGLVDSEVDKGEDGIEKDPSRKSCETDGDTHHFTNARDVSKIASTAKQTNVHLALFWQKFLLCFSAVSNGEKILSVKNTPGSLTCLNGVRVLSMGWVILGHTFSFLVQVTDNPVTAGKLMQSLPFQVIINGTLSVDSFFVMSGLLVTYLFLRETEKGGGVTVKQMFLYYVHRYWRLTPAYAFMIYINTCLVRYFTDGPTWSGPIDQPSCEKNWWLNLLYVNNIVRYKGQCLGWGWFLANDMQFYVVAPLALIPLALGGRRGFGVCMRMFGLCVVAGLVITSIVTTAYFVHDTNSDLLHNSLDFMYNVYIKPWCRVGTFAIGMAVGYILHATKSKIKMSTFLQGMGWFLALVAAGAITLSTYDENGPGRSAWGVGARTAHETLFRPVWGLVLGWVILMCCSGKAGIINWMLSWAWWQPLTRLTYGAFLIHPIIVSMDNVGAATRLVHFTTANLVNRFFGYTCLSYIMAFLLAILVEAPMLQLEKIVLSR